MSAARLTPHGAVGWAETVPEPAPGVYVVSLTAETESAAGSIPAAPLSRAALRKWLEARPELQVDGRRPTVAELATRMAGFWLPDEVILYIGLAGASLRSRVRQYYDTPLGARRPHAGGHFLKTLDNLSDLYVHWSSTDDPKAVENRMLEAFCQNVSERTRVQLLDPEHPFPFANLEWPAGTRKKHGLTGSKGDLGVRENASPRTRRAVTLSSPRNPGRVRVILHHEIARILRERGNRWMTTEELARAVNDAANYQKKDGTPVTAFQIHGRTRNYPQVFDRDGSRVRLRERSA
jgi:hypothetical protein